MKRLALISAITGLTAAIALVSPVSAANPFVGDWTLNTAKSKVSDPTLMPEDANLSIKEAGAGKFRSVSDANLRGNKVHGETVFAIDGNDYAPTSNSAASNGPRMTESSERISATAFRTTYKVDGKVVATVLNEISPDTNTMTQTVTGVGEASGASNVLVYERK